MKLLQAEVEIQIPFEDVDMFQIVWHGHYAKYFEATRCSMLAQLDFTYSQMRDAGFMFPVVDMQIKYIRPLTFGQLICVRATLVEWEAMLKFDYEILAAKTDQLLATGSTKQAGVLLATNKLLRVCPEELRDKIQLAKTKAGV